ncbi:unnamed protein product, partial [Ceratitis capitata]
MSASEIYTCKLACGKILGLKPTTRYAFPLDLHSANIPYNWAADEPPSGETLNFYTMYPFEPRK